MKAVILNVSLGLLAYGRALAAGCGTCISVTRFGTVGVGHRQLSFSPRNTPYRLSLVGGENAGATTIVSSLRF
jgi:hypothetical protein